MKLVAIVMNNKILRLLEAGIPALEQSELFDLDYPKLDVVSTGLVDLVASDACRFRILYKTMKE